MAGVPKKGKKGSGSNASHELLENMKGGQTLIGFPALIDGGDAVSIEVFDEPEVAAAKHRAGLRRLFALQIKDALKYLEKKFPNCRRWAWPTCRWVYSMAAKVPAAAPWKSCA